MLWTSWKIYLLLLILLWKWTFYQSPTLAINICRNLNLLSDLAELIKSLWLTSNLFPIWWSRWQRLQKSLVSTHWYSMGEELAINTWESPFRRMNETEDRLHVSRESSSTPSLWPLGWWNESNARNRFHPLFSSTLSTNRFHEHSDYARLLSVDPCQCQPSS